MATSLLNNDPPALPEMRDPADIPSLRKGVYDSTFNALSNLPPRRVGKYELRLGDVGWTGAEDFTPAQHKDAILRGQTLSRKLRGTWGLHDAETGQQVANRKTLIAQVPWVSPFGTMVFRGNEFVHCLHGSVQVWTETGMVPIREIVNSRMNVRVWSFDFETRQFVLKPVIGWYRNPVRDGMGCAVFRQMSRMSGTFPRFTTGTLWATPGHEIFDLEGRKQPVCKASLLTTVEERLSYTQEQLLYGTLLGDGHIRPDGVYNCGHGLAQKEYAGLKRDILSSVTTEELEVFEKVHNGKIGHGVRFRTRAHPVFHAAREAYYPGRNKIVTQELLDQVDEMGLAFWFGDDGGSRYTRNTNHVTVQLHTQRNSAAGVALIREWLAARWGFSTYTERAARYEGRDCGWVIAMSGESAEHLLDLVAPFLHPCLHYKLLGRPATTRCGCGNEIAKVRSICDSCLLDRARKSGKRFDKSIRHRFGDTATIRTLLESSALPTELNGTERWTARMESAGRALEDMRRDTGLKFELVAVPFRFEEGRGRKYEASSTAYDIQVEGTHNYVANGVLVSNSSKLRVCG